MTSYSDPTIIQLGDKPRIHPASWLVVVAGVISLVVAGFFFFEKTSATSSTDTLKGQINSEQTQLNSLNATATQLTGLDQQAQDLHLLFDNQYRFDDILSTLDQRFYSNMVITNLLLDDKGNVSFSGTTPTYTDYAKIYSSLTDADGVKYFASVIPGAVSQSIDPVTKQPVINFSFVLTLQSQILQTQKSLSLSDLTTPTAAPQ